jgi:hypothetical protein
VTRRLAVLAALAGAALAGDPAAELAGRWSALDPEARAKALDALMPSPSLVARCGAWIADADAEVRLAVVRALLRCVPDRTLRGKAVAAVNAYMEERLDLRAAREREEFAKVLRDYGRKIPPDSEMAAGADWQDPYDPERRKPPPEILAERTHMRGALLALKGVDAKELRVPVLRLFREHHDPEVLRAALDCFAAWRAHEALLDIADLARIQKQGREVGGADVVGREAYETTRLKWDVHKDRLWWSRPEYVPRLYRPLLEAASAIAGSPFSSVRDLDAWILANERALAAKGVRVSAEFRARARTTQG